MWARSLSPSKYKGAGISLPPAHPQHQQLLAGLRATRTTFWPSCHADANSVHLVQLLGRFRNSPIVRFPIHFPGRHSKQSRPGADRGQVRAWPFAPGSPRFPDDGNRIAGIVGLPRCPPRVEPNPMYALAVPVNDEFAAVLVTEHGPGYSICETTITDGNSVRHGNTPFRR